MSIKPHPPTEKYPLGGLKVIVSVWKGSKAEPVVDYRLYQDKKTGKINKRKAQEAAELLEKQLKVELKVRRDNQPPPGSLRTFKDFAESYRKKAGPHASASIINDLIEAFGDAPPDKWVQEFESFIKKQNGRKVRILVNEYRYRPGKYNHKNRQVREVVGKKWKELDRTISASTLKGYRRYYKAICGHAISEDVSRFDRLTVNYGKGIKVGKSESRDQYATDRQRKKIMEVIGNDFPWLLPAVEFACTMPIRPEDLFATMHLLDKDEDSFWRDLPKSFWPLMGLTIDKINEVNKVITYLPKKTWETEKLATPLILPNMMDYMKSRVGDPICNTIFFRSAFKNEDPGRRYPVSYWTLKNTWNKIREKAKVPNLTFYEFTRHDAVNFLRSHNIPDTAIMQYAGWSTRSVLETYDSRNTDRLTRTTYDLLAGAVKKENEGKVVGL